MDLQARGENLPFDEVLRRQNNRDHRDFNREVGKLVAAEDAITVTTDGKIGVGPLFIMRKMPAGWNQASFDWKYAMVMPNGAFFGETRGRNAANLKFCIDCHAAVAEDQDSMMFLPEDLRRN